MIHRILLFCEEVENFVMEIKTPSDATFKDLHDLIMRECGYEEKGNHRFLICDEDWRVRNKIYLYQKENLSTDEDMNLMMDCTLGDFIEDEGQHIAYIYDIDGKHNFLLHVAENIFGEKLAKPIVSRRKGQAPEQFISEEAATPTLVATPTTDENEDEETEEGYEDSELDPEGFEIE